MESQSAAWERNFAARKHIQALAKERGFPAYANEMTWVLKSAWLEQRIKEDFNTWVLKQK